MTGAGRSFLILVIILVVLEVVLRLRLVVALRIRVLPQLGVFLSKLLLVLGVDVPGGRCASALGTWRENVALHFAQILHLLGNDLG